MNPLIHMQMDVYLRRLIAEHIPMKENLDKGRSHGWEAPSKKKTISMRQQGVGGTNDE